MNIIHWNQLDESQRAQVLARPANQRSDALLETVSRILERVKLQGDPALKELTETFDGVRLDELKVNLPSTDAFGQLPAPLRSAIENAAKRIRMFHEQGASVDFQCDTAPGVRCGRITRPIQRIGFYIPAGSAPLFSTLLMLVIPAQLAGVKEIVMCTPAAPNGQINPIIAAVAQRFGVDMVFAVGGAQAIAAMAFGTATIPKCDKIFGPGNAWVDEAKRQVSQRADGAAIDLPAGPSEVLVIADRGANPKWIAADLLAQAEHGPDSQVILLTTDAALARQVSDALLVQIQSLPRQDAVRQALDNSRLIVTESIEQAMQLSNRYAPEHLLLALRDPVSALAQVQAAGSVFLGDWSAETLGDYGSGPNHVLPTGGAARAFSGVSIASFCRSITVQQVDEIGIQCIGPDAITMAEAEGLHAHARAAALRLAALKEVAA